MKILMNPDELGFNQPNHVTTWSKECHVQSGSLGVQVVGNFAVHAVTDVLQPRSWGDGNEFPLPSGSTLRSHRPLELFVWSTSEDDSFKTYRVLGLPISLMATNHDDAVGALYDLIPVLWIEYASEVDANLSPRARELKALLLRDFFVID